MVPARAARRSGRRWCSPVWLDRRRSAVRRRVHEPRRAGLGRAEHGAARWRWVPLALFLLALASASTALARPQAKVSKPAERATIVLLVDVSGSMRADDVQADAARRGAGGDGASSPTGPAGRQGRARLVQHRAGRARRCRPPTARCCTRESTCSCRRRAPRSATVSRCGTGRQGVARRRAPTREGRQRARRDRPALRRRADARAPDAARGSRARRVPPASASSPSRSGRRHGTLGIGPFGGGYGYGGGLGTVAGRIPVLPGSGDAGCDRPCRPAGGPIRRRDRGSGADGLQAARLEHRRRARRRARSSSWFAGLAAMLLLGSLGRRSRARRAPPVRSDDCSTGRGSARAVPGRRLR